MPKASHKYTFTYKPTLQESRPFARFTGSNGQTSSSSSSSSSAAISATLETTLPVRELLEKLRRNPLPISGDDEDVPRRSAPITTPTATVHPSLQEILGVDQTSSIRPRLPRGLAAPDSWRIRRRPQQESTNIASSVNELESRELYYEVGPGSARDVYNLPGLANENDDRLSLVNIIMQYMAQNLDYFENDAICELRAAMKSLFLSHVASESAIWRQNHASYEEMKEHGLSNFTLKSLFLNPKRYDLFVDEGEHINSSCIDVQTLTHLNLANTIGYGISLRDLSTYLKDDFDTLSIASDSKTKNQSREIAVSIVDSWEDALTEDFESTNLEPHSTSMLRCKNILPNLTHLSIAYPHLSVTSKQLLDFIIRVPTLTHLSIAGWPDSSILNKASEWSAFLRRLSRSLVCLKYFDLSDCSLSATEGLKEVDWNGCWRKVTIVVLRQTTKVHPEDAGKSSSIPLRLERAKQFAEFIKTKRSNAKGNWCNVIY